MRLYVEKKIDKVVQGIEALRADPAIDYKEFVEALQQLAQYIRVNLANLGELKDG